MPWYQFNVITALTEEQRAALARAITDMHTRKFHTPSLFVNVSFIDMRASLGLDSMSTGASPHMATYRAGRRHVGNSAHCYVRPGGRARSLFDEVTAEVVQAWDRIVNDGKVSGRVEEVNTNGHHVESSVKSGPGAGSVTSLDAVFVYATIHAAWEAGLSIPEGGQDTTWLLENRGLFEKKAAAGDVEFQELVKEMDTREDLNCLGK